MTTARPSGLGRHSRRRAALMSMTALTTLALTACTGFGPTAESPESIPPSPASSTTSVSAPSTSAAPSPSPPGEAAYAAATEESPARNVPAPMMTDAVEAVGESGARAALDQWWAAHRYLELTGDGQHLDHASGSGCASCVQTRTFWDDLYAKDHWSTGSDRHPVKVTVELSAQETDATLSFVLEQQEYDIWTPEGRTLNPMFRGASEYRDWRAKARSSEDGRWIVYDIWMLYGEREDGGPAEDSEPAGPEPEESEETGA